MITPTDATTVEKRGYCSFFTRNKICNFHPDCKFLHRCKKCDGEHSYKKCPSRPVIVTEYCDICSKPLKGTKASNAEHFNGKAHAKKVNNGVITTAHCKICDTYLTGTEDYNARHFDGKRHNKKKRALITVRCEICDIVITMNEKENHFNGKPHKRKLARKEETESKTKKILDVFSCSVCPDETIDSLAVHLQSERHLKRIENSN